MVLMENWRSHKSQVCWPRWFLFVATWSHKVDQSWLSCISTCVNFHKSYRFFIIAIACGHSWNKADENKAHTSSGSMQVCKWTKQWALWVLHKDELCLSVQQYKQDDRMCQSLGESTGHMSGSMLCSSLPCCRGKNNRDGIDDGVSVCERSQHSQTTCFCPKSLSLSLPFGCLEQLLSSSKNCSTSQHEAL